MYEHDLYNREKSAWELVDKLARARGLTPASFPSGSDPNTLVADAAADVKPLVTALLKEVAENALRGVYKPYDIVKTIVELADDVQDGNVKELLFRLARGVASGRVKAENFKQFRDRFRDVTAGLHGGKPQAQKAPGTAAPPGTGGFRGGRHGDTKLPYGDGLESHHIPAKSVNGLHPDHGPAIQMTPEDHRKTESHGSLGYRSDVYRQRQKKYIDRGQFGKAIQMDIDDIRKKFPPENGRQGKYDKALKELINSLEPWMKKGLRNPPW
jgi:hypothetical protein